MTMVQPSGSANQNPHWLALSDQAGPVDPAGIADLVQRGSLVLELTAPKKKASVLLDYQADDGWPRALSLFHDAAAGMILLHRQGGTVQRHVIPGPLPRNWDLARFTFTWDGPARHWFMRLEDTAGSWAFSADGLNPMPLAGADLVALCAGPNATRGDAAVQWYGFCQTVMSNTPSAWLGHRTPVATQRGRLPVGDLQIGDMVATLDNGYQPLVGLHRMTMPNRGRFAPVLLRAPYFGKQTDILVAGGQLTLLSGAAVEYLFGEDAVLAAASALRDGNAAVPDARRPLTVGVALDLGSAQVIFADGCGMLCVPDGAAGPLPYRVLQDYETLPLQSLMGRSGPRWAA